MQDQLSEIIRGFETAQVRLHALAAGVAVEKFAERNDVRRWSVGECIAHLNMTSRAYVALLNEAFSAAPTLTTAPAHYRRDPSGWLIGKLVGPLPRIGKFKFGRMPTVPAFTPNGDVSRETLLHEFETLQSEQIALVKRAAGYDLQKLQIVSPFNSRMKYNVYSCLALLPPHQHRHLEHAEQVWG